MELNDFIAMDINLFIENFADQFDDTDPNEITAESKFHDFEEWDSLIALAVLNMTEKKYGKKITFDEMKNCVTLSDLFNLIEKK